MSEDIASAVESIKDALRLGKFANESEVVQGIVLRLLACLGWPQFDTEVVRPEFALPGGGRVDIALFHPPSHPIVFIEAKRTGSRDGMDQLFQYAFNTGVPLLVLTNGQKWSFYYPAGQGSFDDRRFYMLDFLERPVEEIIERLERYLSYDQARSKDIIKHAREDCESKALRATAKRAMPEAWMALLCAGDEMLTEMVAEEVENRCGSRPNPDDITEFLESFASGQSSSSAGKPVKGLPRRRGGHAKPASVTADETPSPIEKPTNLEAAYFLDGEWHTQRNATKMMTNALRALSDRDQKFLTRFEARPEHGRLRRYVSSDKYELYPGRPDLAEQRSQEIRPGWWVGTNYNRSSINKILRMASEVAGLRWDVDFRVRI